MGQQRVALVASRFEIWLVGLDPTRGSEIIVVPMATKRRPYPTRVRVIFRRKRGEIVLDPLRTIDKSRLVRQLGELDDSTAQALVGVLQEMFAL